MSSGSLFERRFAMTQRASRSQAKISMNILGKRQIQTIHAASLKILDQTGVAVHDAAALALLKKAGGRVEGDRVRMKAVLVDRALKAAPKSIQMYNRAGEPAMRLEGWNSYYGTGSDCPSAIDPDTGRHRRSTKADVGRLALLCDKLAHIDFCMSMGIASDASRLTSYVHQFDAMVRNTSKPILFTAHDAEDMRNILCLAEIVTGGGRRELEKRPRYVHYNEPVSPLHHTPQGVGKLLFCAEHRIPMIYIASPMMGASAPVTMAGCIALANAESLSGLVIHQLKNPGAPFIFGADASVMDMRTMIYSYGAPELQMMDIAFADLAHHYELPFFCIAGATDSKVLDAQAGTGMAVSLLVSALNGCNLIHDVGYLETGLCCSFESIVLADEIIGMVKRYRAGFEITAETLALDVIDAVGPQGDYLGHAHTLEHFRREVWYPQVFDRRRHEAWSADGSPHLDIALRRKALEVLSAAQPQPFAQGQTQAMDQVLSRRG
jgi:trimethylamine--corrinoid protein Co-methyltransferase